MRIAVITGASSGIGESFALALDREKDFDEVWLIARREEKLKALGARLRNRARILPLDLSEESGLKQYSDILNATGPEICVLVNAAGCGFFGPFREGKLEALLGSIRLNSEALTAMCSISLPYMKSGDEIINIGSNSAWQPVPIQAVYGASKSFVLSFSRALGRELKKDGIGVMCVCPGWIKTEFQGIAEHDRYIKYVDRWYTPEQVADKAIKDLKKHRAVSILGFPVRSQVRLVKFLPVKMIMNIWCRQQGIE